MKCVALLLGLALFVAANAEPEPEPGVHRVTGKFVTHVHHYRIPVSGKGGRGGHGGHGRHDGHGRHGGQGGRGGNGGRGGKGGKENTCQKTGLTGLANSLNKGIQNVGSGIASAFGAHEKNPGLVGKIFGGAQTLVSDVAGGANQAVSDFFCGFNRVFNKIGSDAGKGHLIKGLVSGANVFVTGAASFFGNAGANALGAATSGFSDAVHGRRGKKGYVHDRSRRSNRRG